MAVVEKRVDNVLNVLVLEPYYGGSHKSFLLSLKKLPFAFQFMTFPASKWKWRMRLAAPYFARKLHEVRDRFDRILCSTYVDVATFRGLAPPWVQRVPVLTYFHENQFVYPVQVDDERDVHFALTNVTTALASDSLAFNSKYNLLSFLEGTGKLLRNAYDMNLDDPCEAIRSKASVLPPGIDFSEIDAQGETNQDHPPVILWNHRWEHDKNPDLFFKALFQADREGFDFRVIVLGKSFSRRPSIFDEARERLANRILHFGYVTSRKEYARLLKQGTTVVSTSFHEFFGIAAIEAVRAGCRPLLPKRLSYPELFPEEFLYDDKDFISRLKRAVSNTKRLTSGEAKTLTEPFSWDTLAPAYESWISGRGDMIV